MGVGRALKMSAPRGIRGRDIWQLRLWQEGTQAWHDSICGCHSVTSHFTSSCSRSSGGDPGDAPTAITKDGDDPDGVEELLQAVESAEKDGVDAPDKAVEEKSMCTTGTPLR